MLLEEEHIRRRYRYPDEKAFQFIAGLRVFATVVTNLPEVVGVSRDPNDDVILATARAAQVPYLVTRDLDLLSLQTYTYCMSIGKPASSLGPQHGVEGIGHSCDSSVGRAAYVCHGCATESGITVRRPSMPWNRADYPANWCDEIRPAIFARAQGHCEGSPAYPGCRVKNYSLHPVTGSKVILTTAHLCRCKPKCGALPGATTSVWLGQRQSVERESSLTSRRCVPVSLCIGVPSRP